MQTRTREGRHGDDRRWRQGGRALAAAAIGMLVLATQAVGQSPSAATTSTDDGQVIRDALDALASHTSYRYDWREQGDEIPVERRTTGIVIDGDPFRSYQEMVVKGSVGFRETQVGGEAWRSLYGSAFVPSDPGPDPHPGMLGAWAATLLDIADEGVDLADPVAATIDGHPARHYVGRTIEPAADASPTPFGSELVAVVDLWVAEDGTLLESRVAGTRTGAGFAGGEPEPTTFQESVRIGGIDDPANVIEAPDLGPIASAEPAPPGAADLEPVILAALDELAATPWRGTVDALTLGNVTLTEVTHVPGEPAAAEAWVGWRDQRRYGFRAIGDELWERLAGDAPWEARAGDAPPCFRRTCDAAGIADIAWRVREAVGTFRDLQAKEWIDGVKVRHLRSTAGSIGPNGAIPGRLDLWLSEATGLPVRIDFHGLGIEEEVSFTDVGDPSIGIERP